LIQKLFQQLAALVGARQVCDATGNVEWFERHTDHIEQLCSRHMPHGSGFDIGTKLDLERSQPDKLVFSTSYHHMDEYGGYGGWTDHDVIVTPSLQHGYVLRFTGQNRNGIKEYMQDVFAYALDTDIDTDVELGKMHAVLVGKHH
jgi:hypothetical protein